MIKDKSHIKEAVLYGGLKYDADTTALVVENKKYTDIPRDLNIQHTFYPDSLNLRDGAKYLPATKCQPLVLFDDTLGNVQKADV